MRNYNFDTSAHSHLFLLSQDFLRILNL